MKDLRIKGTKDKPQVNFDSANGILFLGGTSLPDNVLEVFNPILEWINEYKSTSINHTQVVFNFEYLNTSSTNMIAKLIESLYELRIHTQIEFNWYYSSGDYDMRELGLDLLEDMDCQYNIIEAA